MCGHMPVAVSLPLLDDLNLVHSNIKWDMGWHCVENHQNKAEMIEGNTICLPNQKS